MKLRYDADMPHQVAAVAAIVDMFDGQQPVPPLAESFFGGGKMQLSVDATPNRLYLTDAALLHNLQLVQERHNEDAVKNGYAPVVADHALAKIRHSFDGDAKNGLVADKAISFANFSVEMETGTGKTYTFLRAIRELAVRRGFLKFIIITPTVAVRENTLAALAATAGHFDAIYRMPIRWRGYKSEQLGAVGDFARAGDLRVLVMTLAAFNKAANVMLHHSDKMGGELPMAFLQATRPVLILDEPQNMETDLSEESLARLNPLFALRFSATHKTPHNMLFRLSPGNASAAGMVKTIQVGAVQEDNESMPLMELIKAEARGENLSVRIKMNVRQKAGAIKQKIVRCLPWNDLRQKARLPQYDGYIISEIERDPDKVFFVNGKTLAAGSTGKENIFRGQIQMTIEEHFSRQKKLLPRGVKVLSLFFIDRVENYADKDGMIRRIFEEEYQKARQKQLRGKSPALRNILDVAAAEVHDGYFAASKSGNTESDAASFNLIMRDKESLLSFAAADDGEDELRKKRVAFIFSHSALREGWDNPNIFQICTLNASISAVRKRQELGRGLRLCVNQNGERQTGECNILTIIANDSYEQYARDYQNEMTEDYRHLLDGLLKGRNLADVGAEERAEWERAHPGIIPQKPSKRETPAKARKNAEHLRRKKDGNPSFSKDFTDLWERISHKTRIIVNIDDNNIIAAAAAGIIAEGESIADPKITYVRAELRQAEDGKIRPVPVIGARSIAFSGGASFLPDMPGLMSEMLKQYALPVHISRRNLLQVFLRAVKNAEQARKARENPIGWAAKAAEVICREIRELKADGVRYEKTGKSHQWRQMFANDLAGEDRDAFALYYAATNGKGKPSKNSIADFIACDSKTEQTFAEDLAQRGDIKLFVKLPRWFSVHTPVGKYCPDWAILLEYDNTEKLYLINETKAAVKDGKIQWNDLRAGEKQKILCAAKHFGSEQQNEKGALDGVDYKVASEVKDIKPPDRRPD